MSHLPLVEDMMDHQFPTVRPETRIEAAIDLLIDKNLIGVLVVDAGGALRGIFSEKDSLRTLLRDSYHQLPDDVVENYMHEPPAAVGSKLDIVRVAQLFMGNNFRRLPVVDDGRLVGQITRRDIMRGMRKYR